MAETITRRTRDGAWVRDVLGEYTAGGYPLVVHLAGRDDATPSHRTYPTGYDSRCGYCYVGANHSEAAHNERVRPGFVRSDV